MLLRERSAALAPRASGREDLKFRWPGRRRSSLARFCSFPRWEYASTVALAACTAGSDPVKCLPQTCIRMGVTQGRWHSWRPCCLWLRLLDPNKWKPDPRGFSGMENEGRASCALRGRQTDPARQNLICEFVSGRLISREGKWTRRGQPSANAHMLGTRPAVTIKQTKGGCYTPGVHSQNLPARAKIFTARSRR